MSNKKIYGKTLVILSLMVFLTACNVSKSLTKKGDKLAEAGIHAEAVQYYIQALNRDRSTIEAQIGLRKSGNEVMSDYHKDQYNTNAEPKLEDHYLVTRSFCLHAELKNQFGGDSESDSDESGYGSDSDTDYLDLTI